MNYFWLALFAFMSACASFDSKNSKKSEIILLGVPHGKLEKEIGEKLEGLSPDAVLLEYPLEWFEASGAPTERLKPHLVHNPMWQFCKRKNRICAPFDIRGRNEFYKKTDFLEREDRFLKNFLEKTKIKRPVTYNRIMQNFDEKAKCSKVDLAQMNSKECDAIVQRDHQYRKEVISSMRKSGELNDMKDLELIDVSNDEWERRTRAMAKNVCHFAKVHKDLRRVVVTVGYEHRYDLKPALMKCEFADLVSAF